jgi:hypothetical protein
MDEILNDEEKSQYNTPQAPLEMMFIDEYLKSKGYHSLKDMCHLPEAEAKTIMMQACKYASLKLAEIESRAQFRKEIHGE